MASSSVAGSQIVVENLLQKETIRLKDRLSRIKQVANTKYQGELRNQGDTVSVQTFPNAFGNMGGTAGGTISTPAWAIKDEQLQVTEVMQNGRKVKDIEEVQSNLNLVGRFSERFAYFSADNEDRYVASFFTDADSANKLQDKVPLTLTTSNTYSSVTSLTRVLSQNNAFASRMLFVSPAIHEKFRLENILNSNEGGLDMRLNGLVGRLDGFSIIETNNLPHATTLTVDTQVTATDTLTIPALIQDTSGIAGYVTSNVVWTFTAAASAASPGDIALGASLALTQANIVDAINGTGTPGASTYIDVSAADRVALKNLFINAGAFDASDIATIRTSVTTAFAETFTAGTNIFGADAVLMTAVDNEAINAVFQMDKFKVKDLDDAFSANILQEKIFGGKVFDENAKGLATIEIAV